MGKVVSIAYESKSDIAALREDGYKDGLVNSDSAFDGAIDDMRGKPNPQALIEPNVDIAVKSYRDDLVEAIAGPRSKMQDLEEVIAYDGNKKRSESEQKKHLEAYLDGYRSGFRVRLQNAVRDGDAAWGAGERQSAHPFFISYWGRNGKQEALIWAKDEQSALGLLRSAIPSADIRSVEQREAEPGIRRGRNVYAMGSEAGEAAEEMGAGESGASEGPHAQPFAPAAGGHACTKDTALTIAQQIPGGPWAFVKAYPKEAQARVDRQQDVEVTTPQGRQRVTAYYCGRHLMLRCPTTGTQFLFESSCIGDVPSGRAPAAPQYAQPAPGRPFTVRLKRDGNVVSDAGPFETASMAYAVIEKAMGSKKGDLAGIYGKDGKIIDFRGGKAVYVFGRTRWSRA